MADWINDLAESAAGQWLNLSHAEQATQQGNYAVDAGNAFTGSNNRHAGNSKPKKQTSKAKKAKKTVPDYDPYSYIQNNDNAQDIGNAVASIMPEDTTLADSQADMTSNLVDSHYAMTPAVESVIGKNANDIIKDLAVAAGAGAVNSVKMMADTANMLTGDQFDWGQRYFDQASQGLTGDASKNYQGDARGMYSDEMIRQLKARAANEKAGTNFNPENLWDTARSHVADMVNSGFTMIPIVATGGALGRIPGLAKLSPEALSMVSNSLMNAGDTFTEARENGADLGSAYLGGLVSGGISAVADRLTGGGAEAGFLRRMLGNNNIEREVLEKELNLSRLGNIGNSVKNFLWDRAKDTAGEMAEESGNLLGADVARSSTQGTGLQLSSGRKYLNTAGNAGLQSLFGQAHGDIISNTQHAIENDRRIQEVNRNVDDIKQKLDRMSPTQQAVWESQNKPDAQKPSMTQLQQRAEEIKNNREKGIEVSREEVKQGVIQNTVNEITGDTIKAEQQSPLDQYIQQKANEYRAEQMQKQEDDVNELNDLVQTVDAQRQQNDMLVAENQVHQEANQNLTAQNEELTAQNELHQQTIEQQAIQQEQQNLAHSEQMTQQQVEHEADLAVQQESHQAEKEQIAQDVGQAMQAQQIQHEQEMQAVQQQAQQAVAQAQAQNAQPVSQTNEMQPVQQPVRMDAEESQNNDNETVAVRNPDGSFNVMTRKSYNEQVRQKQKAERNALLARHENKIKTFNAQSETKQKNNATYIKERLNQAVTNGEIKKETADFASWVIDQAPHLTKDLDISVQDGEPGVAGIYNSIDRIATLIKKNDNVETAVHEILHHAERMMPQEVQDGIRNEMKRQLDKAIANEINPETKTLLQRMKDSHNGDSTARQEIKNAFENGSLDKNKHYQFMDASEFWTVNGSRLLHNQYKAQGNWREKAKQFLRRMYNFFRNKMGMSSDAPVMRGLREVINGKGDFVDGARMLRNYDGQFKLESLSNKQQSNPVVSMLMQNGMTQEQAEAAVKQMQDSGMLTEQKQEEKAEPVAQEEVKPVSEEKTEQKEEAKPEETEEQVEQKETTEETEEETESEPEDNGDDGENTTPPELQWHPKDQNWAQKKGDNLVRALQDKMVDVKRVQEAILRAALGDKFTKESRLDEDKDVYLQEGLYESKVKQRIDNLNIRYTKPILERLNKLKDNFGRDMTAEEAGKWLYARHVILDKVNTKLAEKNGSESGKLSGMTDEEAQEIYDRYAGNEDMEAVGKMVDKMVRDHLNQRVADGLLSKETADQWIKDRPHYVPLKRDNILVTDEDGNVTEIERGNTMKSTGKGVAVRGSESNERKGSEREATNILANIFQRMEEGITRGEKNKVGQTMVRLVESAPNKNFWSVEKASGNKEYGDNTIPVKINGVEHRIVFNADNELAMHVCKALQGTNVKQLNWFAKKFGQMNRYMGGWLTSKNPVFAFFNFLRDAQHMYFNLSDTPLSGKALQVYKNYPSAMRGVWEVLRNGKEGKEIEYGEDGLPKTSADWFREFQDSGAATGFIDLTRNPKERMKDLQKQLDRMKSDPVKAFRVMGQFLEDYNEIAENGTRLSVYMEARRNGMSKAKAADLARNITVDFNRKGTHTGVLGSFYLFANANIQGHARMFRAIKNSRKAKALATAMVGIGVAMSVIGRLGMGKDPDTGEDRWDQIPEHEKAQNYIVPIGWMTGKPGDYFKVPVAQGLNILPTTGRIMSDVAFDIMEGRDPNWGARLGTMLVNSIDAINVLGASGSPWQAVTPTALRPIAQWIEGKDWTGGALYKKDIYNTKKPAYTRAFKSTSSVFIDTSKALSDMTGGNKVNAGFIDIPPEVLKSFATTWGFPGWSNIASQAVRAVEQYRSYDSEGKTRLNIGDIPVLNRLVGDASSRKNISRTAMDVSNDMKDLHDKIENNRKELKKMREDGKKDTDEYKEMRESNRELLRKLGGGNMTAGQDMMDAYDDYISNLKAVSKKNTESMKSIKAQREKAETYDYDKRSEVNDKIDERENRVKVLYEERRKVIQQGFIKALENIKDGKRGEEIMKGVKDWNEVTF